MALFKNTKNAPDGTVLTSSNCLYVHSMFGNDSTGDGTSLKPYATLTKAKSVNQSAYHIVSGVFAENINYGGYGSNVRIIIDNDWTSFIGIITLNNYYGITNIFGKMNVFSNVNLNLAGDNGGSIASKIRIINANIVGSTTSAVSVTSNNVFISNLNMYTMGGASGSSYVRVKNFTIYSAVNYFNGTFREIYDSIFVSSIDLYNYTSRGNVAYYPIFKYCLFRKATLWKWNGVTITINWTTNPLNSTAYTNESLLDRVYNSLLYYANNMTAGTDKTYFQAILASVTTMFYADESGQTNKVVDDSIYPIFNKYDNGVPIDYTLKLASNNVALTMSSTGSYVGAYKANLNNVLFGPVINVNADGSDDLVTPADLLISEGNGKFSASQTSVQLRNRVRTIVQEFPRGKTLEGGQSDLRSGLSTRLFFGKKQPLSYSGTAPTVPVESFEAIVYDSIPANNTPEAANDLSGAADFPRFSMPFNEEVLMWYKGVSPLLFNQLSNLYTGPGTVTNTAGSTTVTGTNTLFTTYLIVGDLLTIAGQTVRITAIASATSLTVDTAIINANTNASYTVGVYCDKALTEYGTWAVTNADIENYSLSFKTAYTTAALTAKTIAAKYIKAELNLNYDELD